MDKGLKNKKKFKLQHWQKISAVLAGYDVITVILSYFLALWFRFDGEFSSIPERYIMPYYKFILIYAALSLFIYWRLRLYKSIWRFAGYNEMFRCFTAVFLSWVLHVVLITVFLQRMPLSYYCFGAFFQFFFIIIVRFSYRFVLLEREKVSRQKSATKKRAMLIGAGMAGQAIIKESIETKDGDIYISCIIDDNVNKSGRYIHGVPVVGTRDEILYNVKKYSIDIILFAIPSATAEEKRDILDICKETKCQLKSLPGTYQIVNGEVSISKMNFVAIEDLLGREPVKVDLKEIDEFIDNKVVLVTGGGGSIGSELCRQIAKNKPKELVIFDIYENNAYEIEQELKRKHPELNLTVLIGSVRDSNRINMVFEKHRPDVVYHAAAHKHVPLMESSPCEAIKNNVVGTYKTASAALKYGCERFVLISTDKAVNPTNVMGASKRICEMVIQSMDKVRRENKEHILPCINSSKTSENRSNKYIKGRTEFVAVRFGNVLGSNGSVIPLFKKQIEAGGPVTVTHPDVVRYFMTIPEAVSLVLQAGIYAKGGEIFVLDMGEPVKIDNLAKNLIKLSGHQPGVDIQIEYTGLRPGEKLYEEKLMSEEGLKKTANKLIHIGVPIPFDTEVFLKQLEELAYASYVNSEDIADRVCGIVCTYNPATNNKNIKEILEVMPENKKEVAFETVAKVAN